MPKKLVMYPKLAAIMASLEKHITTGSPERWKRIYQEKGQEGLINSKPCPENLKLRTPLPIEELILHLRRTYHLGQHRIKWYLARYHDIEISEGAVYNVLKRNGLNPLPKNQRKRCMKSFKRYEKRVPGHRIQTVRCDRC